MGLNDKADLNKQKNKQKNKENKLGKKSKSKRKSFLPFLFLGGAVLFLFLSFLEERGISIWKGKNSRYGGSSTPEPYSPEYTQKVNEHLKATAQNIRIQNQAMGIENKNSLSRGRALQDMDLSDDDYQGFQALPPRVDPQDQHLNELLRKIREPLLDREGNEGPGDVVQYELFQAQAQRDYDEAYKKAYAEAFVENARKQGFKIELTPDYRVLSVKKIVKPNRPSLFEP
jgi:hypothetical protein